MAQEDVFKKLVAHCKEYGLFTTDWELYMITDRTAWN